MTTLFFIYISFGISLIEEIIFVTPSTLVQITLGGFLLNNPLDFYNLLYFISFIVLPSALGVAVGSIPIFLISKISFSLVERNQNFLQKIILKIKTGSLAHKKESSFFFLLMRSLPNFSGLVSTIIGGLWNLSLKKFFVLTFLGSIIRIFILGMIGWQASHYIYIFTGKYGWIGFSIGIIFITTLFIPFLFKKSKVKEL